MTVAVSRKNSYPLTLLVDGTKKLVEKIHEGSSQMVKIVFETQLSRIDQLE